ncbi:MAG: hypothetical protein JWO06_3733 [Bacteroidota bacterium]|nr:hypothetical protein [Bacteroidota bacterium]
MKIAMILFALISFSALHAQDSTKVKKKSFTDKVKEIPDMLIAQPDKGVDTMANKLRNDNLYITINPVWKDKGTNIGNDLKLQKINEEPLNETFPLSDKKILNGMVLTMLTQKKTAQDKKDALANQVRTHLLAIYKESGKASTPTETNTQVNSMISGPEAFTTAEGKTGELYFVNDIQTEQSNFLIVLILPGTKPGTTCTVQFNYYHYNYETNYPDDILELKAFGFSDDQKEYVEFTKKMLKSLQVQ